MEQQQQRIRDLNDKVKQLDEATNARDYYRQKITELRVENKKLDSENEKLKEENQKLRQNK